MARNTYSQDETLERKFDLSKLKRALIYLKPHKAKLITAILLSSLSSILSLLPPYMLSKAIDEAIPDGNIKMLVHLALITIGALIISTIFGSLRGVIMAKVGQNIIYKLRMDVFKHLQKLPFSYYDSRPHGKILVRVVNYVNNVSNTLSNGIINAIINVFNLIFITIYMFLLDVKLSIVICLGLPPLLLIIFLLKSKQKKTLFEFNNKNSNLTAFTCEFVEGVKVTQTFNRQQENLKIYNDLNNIYRKYWYKMCLFTNLLSPISELLKQIIMGLVYITGILWISPSVEIGVLIAMASYATSFWQPIISLANIYNNFLTTISYLERIFQTLDEPIEINDKPTAKSIDEIKGNIKFENVNFEYEKDIKILKDICFEAKAGESIALVGPTGSGKTTIVNLVSRFYNVTDGKILIDDVPIEDIKLNSLRKHVSVMMQDSFIFSGSIADNIRYGKLDATDEEVIDAAKIIGADKFISEMKDGYNTVVSEKGGQLSQGEKQLISLARTLLSNPSVLILDEATSSIDAKTEQLLQEGISNLLKNRTSIIIAHRLSTIKNCDKILFIKDGKIAESGSHEALMKKKGLYYTLYTTQSIDK